VFIFGSRAFIRAKHRGGEAHGIFRGQLEEGDAGIRKLAILLLVDWEYVPDVGREHD